MIASLAAQSAPLPAARLQDMVTLVVVTLGLTLVGPYAAIAVLGGGPVRTIYPVYILGVAGLVILYRRPFYPAFMFAVFSFAPFLRRVADYQAGFVVLNLILLAPYFGLLPTLPALLRRAFGARALGWPFAVILGCVTYGFFIAMYRLAFVQAAYEAMVWLMPVAFCAFIMDRPEDAAEMRRAALVTLGLILPIMTAYGIYQFITAPPWDVLWMLNIENPTFGVGEPFRIRVFSMLNSPGAACVISALAMVLLAGDGLLGMLVAAVGLPLLALTVIRTGWFVLVVGLAVIVWKASSANRVKLSIGLAVIGFVTVTALASQALPPEVRNLVTDRLATFSDLGTDTSTSDRLGVYQAFFARLAASPWGEGFGANESTLTRRQSGLAVVSIDSGIMEAYLIYGVLVGTAYFAAFIELMRSAWRDLSVLPSKFGGHGGVIVAVAAALPLGSIQTGEGGIMLWGAVGLLLANGAAIRNAVAASAGQGRRRRVS